MEKQTFTTVIKPKSGWFDLHLKEVFAYRDLIFLFVKRNFVSKYKQTILGPAWAIIQPLLTTVVFTLVFGNIAGLSPDGVPPFIFYLAGTVLWTYFSGCLTQTANTFVANSATMGKVYFPRLVMPISTVFSELISFAIQYGFLLIFLVYYTVTKQGVHPNLWMLMTPLIILQLAMLSLGCGIIITATLPCWSASAYSYGCMAHQLPMICSGLVPLHLAENGMCFICATRFPPSLTCSAMPIWVQARWNGAIISSAGVPPWYSCFLV